MELKLDISYTMAVTAKVKSGEYASISSILNHAEAPELQNISRIAASIKTQEDFMISIYERGSGRFSDLSIAMSRASVNNHMQIPVLMINQCYLLVHPPYGMVSCIQGYVRYKMLCNLGASVWLSVGLILASSPDFTFAVTAIAQLKSNVNSTQRVDNNR